MLAKTDEKWKVSFVDYGNTSEVSIADMRPLKEEHASLPAQSIPCLLRGFDKSEWAIEDVGKFDDATRDATLDVINYQVWFAPFLT